MEFEGIAKLGENPSACRQDYPMNQQSVTVSTEIKPEFAYFRCPLNRGNLRHEV